MKYFSILLLILFMAVSASQAQFRKVGTTGYVFLEIPVTARMAAMGETSVALTDVGAEALFTNPSLLGYAVFRHNIHASYANYLADIQHQALGYGIQLTPIGAFGISINRLNLGEMVETVNADPNNPGGGYLIIGKYSADALAVGLTYARKATTWFSYGITAKYVRERISIYESNNVLVDIGVIYCTQFHSLRIGGYIQNFGVDSKYIGDTFKMPTTFRLGAAAELVGDPNAPTRLTLSVDALHPSDYTERLNVGTEYWIQNILALRAGYKFNYDEEGWTLGMGLKWKPNQNILNIDIAYTYYGRLESVSRFSTNIAF
jgi:opacity protein-like surface antigen